MSPTAHVAKGSYATYELTYGVSEVILETIEAFGLTGVQGLWKMYIFEFIILQILITRFLLLVVMYKLSFVVFQILGA
jgi:hypothetical protein